MELDTWYQCDLCNKWRRLHSSVPITTPIDRFVCHKLKFYSCKTPEELDADHDDSDQSEDQPIAFRHSKSWAVDYDSEDDQPISLFKKNKDSDSGGVLGTLHQGCRDTPPTLQRPKRRREDEGGKGGSKLGTNSNGGGGAGGRGPEVGRDGDTPQTLHRMTQHARRRETKTKGGADVWSDEDAPLLEGARGAGRVNTSTAAPGEGGSKMETNGNGGGGAGGGGPEVGGDGDTPLKLDSTTQHARRRGILEESDEDSPLGQTCLQTKGGHHASRRMILEVSDEDSPRKIHMAPQMHRRDTPPTEGGRVEGARGAGSVNTSTATTGSLATIPCVIANRSPSPAKPPQYITDHHGSFEARKSNAGLDAYQFLPTRDVRMCTTAGLWFEQWQPKFPLSPSHTGKRHNDKLDCKPVPKRKWYTPEGEGERLGDTCVERVAQCLTTNYENSFEGDVCGPTHNGNGRRKIHVFGSHLLPWLVQCAKVGTADAKQWTYCFPNFETASKHFSRRRKGPDITDTTICDWLVFIINETAHHWYLLVADLHELGWVQLDSAGNNPLQWSSHLTTHAQLVLPYLKLYLNDYQLHAHGLTPKRPFIWREPRRARVPEQPDGTTCGVFTLCNLECLMMHNQTTLGDDLSSAWKGTARVEVIHEWLYFVLNNIGVYTGPPFKQRKVMPVDTTGQLEVVYPPFLPLISPPPSLPPPHSQLFLFTSHPPPNSSCSTYTCPSDTLSLHIFLPLLVYCNMTGRCCRRSRMAQL